MAPELRAVVIGGAKPEGIATVIGGLPASGVAVLVVSPEPGPLVKLLRTTTRLRVDDAQPQQRLAAGHVYVLPPNKDVTLRRGELAFDPPTVPAVQLDRLLRSMADELGRDTIAVVLAGSGCDGAVGVKRIKELGGLVFVEAPEEGPLAEAPRLAIASGAADRVAPVGEIAEYLTRIVGLAAVSPEDGQSDGTDALRDIVTLLRLRTGHDFSVYKRATLHRRVGRRMQLSGISTTADYQQYLRDRPDEVSLLLRDFLISVTNFFRDPDAYAALATQVIPRLFNERSRDEQLRVWVAGCATGEEVYSLGMLLLEHAPLRDRPQIQMFATDIDEEALAIGRAGRYPETIAVDVSPERLERFFVRDGGGFRVGQELRELVLFSPHNVLRDPPFSRLDLVSCRNLMIYLDREAQNRLLALFHFALRGEGYLFLGASESAEGSMFSVRDPKHRVFVPRMASSSLGVDAIIGTGRWHVPPPAVAQPPPIERTSSFGELHLRLVERYAPPSILVNGELDVVHISEHAGKYLVVSGGEPTRSIFHLIHPALRLDLRTAIHAARQPGHRLDVRRIEFEEAGKRRAVDVRVRSVEISELGPNAVLVYLDEAEPATDIASAPTNDKSMEPVVRELEDELRRTRDQLRTTIEQYETSLEELQASNEELQAINEELRSASEELETSKEETQSINEELTSLNHELKAKIDELSHAHSDMQNLMTSTDIGVVFLDRALNITRFTPRVLDLFNLIASDIGRPLAHVTHKLDTDELPGLAQNVLQHLHVVERDVSTRGGDRYLVRVLPYRSLDDRIVGVVLTFVDVSDLREAVDARRRTEAALQASETRLRVALRGSSLVVISLDANLASTWGYVLDNEVGPGIDATQLVAPADAAKFATIAREAIAKGTTTRAEIELAIKGETRAYEMRFEPLDGGVTAIGYDITPNRRAEAALREADRRKDEFLAVLAHELRNPLTPLKVALDMLRRADDVPAPLAKSHAMMDRQVDALVRLVDELVDVSGIAQGKISLERGALDVASVVESAAERTASLFRDGKLELQIDLPSDRIQVDGDLARLTQVVVNLLSNAAKYTPAGGHVMLTVARNHERVRLRVRDDGIGMAPELLPRIFDLFAQGSDGQGRSNRGLGVGLNLVKRLVELHGGRVSATSAGPNHGSEFTVELPMIMTPP